jgi:adenosylmethionine---8-amino-7-oxononanoate aminotransferase
VPTSPDDLRELDRKHLWHPYAAIPAVPGPYLVAGAQGVRLRLADGRELVDGMSSWWAAIHGYRHPVLDQAVTGQLARMAHVMFGGLTHEPAIRLAERLVSMTPPGLAHVFFTDSGSVAVEVAIKMAAQYGQARGCRSKTRFLALHGGYHGDTLGAMSVTEPGDWMQQLFPGVLTRQLFASRPPAGAGLPAEEAWLAELDALLAEHAGELAAVIAEPVVQGAGGMHFYSPAYVTALRDRCDRHGLLLILDEIATGFGRAGELFAAGLAGISPDIMCVGKALTGGYLSMAATLCTSQVAEAISAGPGGAFMHGPTFMGNPLAAAVALASTGLLLDRDWRADVARVSAGLRAGLAPAAALPGVRDVRVLGAIGVIELDHPVDLRAATEAAVAAGAWLRPFRNLVYAMPPYLCTATDLDVITTGMLAAVKASTVKASTVKASTVKASTVKASTR